MLRPPSTFVATALLLISCGTSHAPVDTTGDTASATDTEALPLDATTDTTRDDAGTAGVCEVPGATLAELEAYVPHENPKAEELAIACGDPGRLFAERELADRIARDFTAIRRYDRRVTLANEPVSPLSVDYMSFQVSGDIREALAGADFPWPCFHEHLHPTLGEVRYADYAEPPYTWFWVSFEGVYNLSALADAYLSIGADDQVTVGTDNLLISPGAAVNLVRGETTWQYEWRYVIDDVRQTLAWQVDEDGAVRLVDESCEVGSGQPENEDDCARLDGGPELEEAVPVAGTSCGAGRIY